MDKHKAPLVPEPEVRDSKTGDDNAVWSLRHIQVLWSWASRPAKAKPVYPPISSVPRTSAARLSEPDVAPSPLPSEPILAKTAQQIQNAPSKPKTVLYLAYGSNMCAETFLGMRGIRPLSQINVSAPSLDLTFDLPGLPYREPCFANTAIRKVPAKPPVEPPKLPPEIPDHPPIKLPPATQAVDGNDDEHGSGRQRDPVWTKGLYGVVYEVTPEDYAKIVATEGGGASYHDILVPCFVLPSPTFDIPENKPSLPLPPAPFLAHTLYAPRLPTVPDNDDANPPDSTTNPSPFHRLLQSLLSPRGPRHRTNPNYSQPSLRYLNLLRAGAREHALPPAYQSYLASLQPYTITTFRQKLGQTLFLGMWLPLIILVMMGGRLFADEKGKAPGWMVAVSTVVFNLVWASYDLVGRRVFGDGERTMDESDGDDGEGKVGRARRGSFASGLRGKEEADDEEKRGLLDGE